LGNDSFLDIFEKLGDLEASREGVFEESFREDRRATRSASPIAPLERGVACRWEIPCLQIVCMLDLSGRRPCRNREPSICAHVPESRIGNALELRDRASAIGVFKVAVEE